ncbi:MULTISPECIES: hypothetical protein [unclassified Spiroplasma]|uniref:hypothetical protein n=1 Tax=unclassified Spiroplasma TaxID=2637901 RepID=UPI0030CC9676
MTIKEFNYKYKNGYIVKKLPNSEKYLFLYVIGNDDWDWIAWITEDYFNSTGHLIEPEVVKDFISIKLKGEKNKLQTIIEL